MNNFIIITVSFLSFSYANLLIGLDVFEEEDFSLLYNKKVGLVINHTSLNNKGIHILELLSNYDNIYIQSIFTPEHGLKGNFSAGEEVPDSSSKIISLYGSKHEPTLKDLLGLDYIIFDIQDIGSRYYTYISTLTHVLNAASKAKIPVIILDRPNPLGRSMSGPNISKEFYSFVGMHSIPIRHGMTIGELAIMINNENWLSSGKKVDLTVYGLKGWDTYLGYFLSSPSPNIPNLETAIIYNGMCLLEGTNLSEGRGTKTPFLLFGSPWLDSYKIIEDLNKQNLSGVQFYQRTFKPRSIKGVSNYPKYKGELCYGIKINIFDKDKINPLEVAVFILKTIYKYHPNKFSFNNNNFIEKLYGSKVIKSNITNQESISILIDDWEKSVKDFEIQRKRYLLY